MLTILEQISSLSIFDLYLNSLFVSFFLNYFLVDCYDSIMIPKIEKCIFSVSRTLFIICLLSCPVYLFVCLKELCILKIFFKSDIYNDDVELLLEIISLLLEIFTLSYRNRIKSKYFLFYLRELLRLEIFSFFGMLNSNADSGPLWLWTSLAELSWVNKGSPHP